MRTLVLTVLAILGVVFSGTHVSAFQHIDEDAGAFVNAGAHPHSHADDDHDDDGAEGSDTVGSEVGTHNHCAMDRAVGASGVACLVRVASQATRPPATRALSSLDQAPPLEPPSA